MESYSYYSNSLSVCSDSSIDVTGISVLCDTPGVWYYGSSGYRQSQSCQNGDKAYLTLTFDIVDEDMDADYIYLTLSIFGGDQEVIVYQNALLCSIGTLQKSSGVACPNQGSFTISTKFYFDSSSNGKSHDDDNNWNDRYLGDDDSDDTASSTHKALFTPLVTVGFASSKNREKYDLGGANTDLCGGESKNIQSDIYDKMHKSASHPMAKFLISFGVIMSLIAALGVSTYYVWNSKLCKQISCDTAVCRSSEDHFADYELEDDYFDDRKIELMRKNAAMLSL